MSALASWLVVLAAGFGTFLIRLSFIQFADRRQLPRSFVRALRFVPPAVLSAIILPAVLKLPGGTLDYAPGNPKIIAAVIAALIAWATKNALFTILGGMAAFWALSWLT